MKVLDRTELILDIFASRRRRTRPGWPSSWPSWNTPMPRLKRMWTHLSRQKKGRGPARAGRKTVGRGPPPGRTADQRPAASELRCDRAPPPARSGRPRRPDDRLAGRLHQRRQEHALERADRRRRARPGRLVRHARHAHPPLATARLGAGAVERHGGLHSRSAAPFDRQFKATLEEARQANLLLHVADAANPAVYEQIAAAYQVLEEIDIQQKDTLLVLNKIDALPDRVRLDGLLGRYPNAMPISARSGLGLDELAAAVSEAPEPQFPRRGRGDGRRQRPRCWPTWPPMAKSSPRNITTSGWAFIAAFRAVCLGRIERTDVVVAMPHRNGDAAEARNPQCVR